MSGLTAVALGLALAATAGCGSPIGCPPIVPSRLPDGSLPGPAAQELESGVATYQWGAGIGRVSERVRPAGHPDLASCGPGEAPALGGCIETTEQTMVREHPSVFFADGDPPRFPLTMVFVDRGCVYEVTVGPGLTMEQVTVYAAQF